MFYVYTHIVREVDVWTRIASTLIPRYSYWETFPPIVAACPLLWLSLSKCQRSC